MGMNIIAKIEDGILGRIKAAQDTGALGYRFKKLTTYGGEFSEGLSLIIRDFPAVFVIFSGAHLLCKTNNRAKFNLRFGVIICARNLRSEEAARKGDHTKTGSYKMIMDVSTLLLNQSFGLPIDPIKIEAMNPLSNDQSDRQLASIYGLDLSTTCEIEGFEDGSSLDDFRVFHGHWDNPAATDHVILEVEK